MTGPIGTTDAPPQVPDTGAFASYSHPTIKVVRSGDSGTPVPELGAVSERIAEGIQFGVCIILVGVWAIVGFVFWIPFLVRSIAAYTGAVLGSTFTGSPIYSAQRGLDTSVRFWFGGFQAALAARHSIKSAQNPYMADPAPAIKGVLDMLFHHLLFTMLFWVSVTFLWIAPWRS